MAGRGGPFPLKPLCRRARVCRRGVRLYAATLRTVAMCAAIGVVADAPPKLSRLSCAVRACASAPRRSCRECAASWAVAAAYALVFPRRSRSVRECASPKLARVCVSDVRAGVHFFHGSLPMCESLSVVMVHLVPHVPVRDRRTEELSVVHRRPRYRLRWNPSQARARVRFLSPF